MMKRIFLTCLFSTFAFNALALAQEEQPVTVYIESFDEAFRLPMAAYEGDVLVFKIKGCIDPEVICSVELAALPMENSLSTTSSQTCRTSIRNGINVEVGSVTQRATASFSGIVGRVPFSWTGFPTSTFGTGLGARWDSQVINTAPTPNVVSNIGGFAKSDGLFSYFNVSYGVRGVQTTVPSSGSWFCTLY